MYNPMLQYPRAASWSSSTVVEIMRDPIGRSFSHLLYVPQCLATTFPTITLVGHCGEIRPKYSSMGHIGVMLLKSRFLWNLFCAVSPNFSKCAKFWHVDLHHFGLILAIIISLAILVIFGLFYHSFENLIQSWAISKIVPFWPKFPRIWPSSN